MQKQNFSIVLFGTNLVSYIAQKYQKSTILLFNTRLVNANKVQL